MSTVDATQLALIRLLAPGDWVSGAAIAAELALSREAISKRAARLAALDLAVEARAGRGYRLRAPLELLDAARIRAELPADCALTLLPSTDSTNAWLAAHGESSPQLCLAEHQSAGRGRRGRQWHSPFGRNLYLSLRWQAPAWPERLPALSLVLGVAIAEYFHQQDVPLALKWPNDLYLAGRKLGGLLIEQRGEANGPCLLIIGLGLNLGMREAAAIDREWTSLAREGFDLGRNALAGGLGACLLAELEQLDGARVERRLAAFARFDQYAGCAVSVDGGGEAQHGIARGIDEWGRLRLATDAGEARISVGDVSLRRAAAGP